MVIGVRCIDFYLLAYAIIKELLTHSAEPVHFLDRFGVVFIIHFSELSCYLSIMQDLVED